MAPVPESFVGVWGKPTALVDWCEENYTLTPYVAEFWNTVSNLFFIIPSFVTLLQAIYEDHEDRFKWCYLSIMCVGIGSWCFHMTLLYSMQLLDELPMIYGSCFLLYSNVLTVSNESKSNHNLKVGLISSAVIVTLIYLLTKNVLFFQLSYVAYVACMLISSFRIIFHCKYHKRLYICTLAIYMSGAGLWLIDQQFCRHLRIVRHDLLPSALVPLTQLHAWWHVLAGIGTYLSVVFVYHTRHLNLNNNPEIKYFCHVWPYVTLQNQKISYKYSN